MSSSRFVIVRGSRALVVATLGAIMFLGAVVPAQDVLVPAASEWRYFKGTEEPPAEWKDLAFDDSGDPWLTGATPIGYSADLTYATVLGDMQQVTGGSAGYFSVYLRHKFQADPAAASLLKLRVTYDDGFIAYLNGTELVRASMPAGTVAFDTAATDHETLAADFVIPCSTIAGLIRDGDNVFAVQVHNATLASSDLSLEIVLETFANVCPESMAARELTNNRVQVTWKKPTGFTLPYETLTLTRNGEDLPLTNTGVASYVDTAPVAGSNVYVLDGTMCGQECHLETTIVVGPVGTPFRRGDGNGDGGVNITDAVYVLMSLFRGGDAPTCPDTADSNDDGTINLTDPVYLLRNLFQGGEEPPAPGISACGVDPEASEDEDGLGACVYTTC